jgi:hypothetical protein
MKAGLLLFTLFFLISCASNPYKPYKGGTGYSEIQTGKGTYEIQFHGSSKQDGLKAKEYAIARAAEIARSENAPYFKIADNQTKEGQEFKSYYSPGYYPYYSYPGYGYYYGWYGSCYNYVETQPVVRITVTLENEACDGCRSTNQEIQEARASGILNQHAG